MSNEVKVDVHTPRFPELQKAAEDFMAKLTQTLQLEGVSEPDAQGTVFLATMYALVASQQGAVFMRQFFDAYHQRQSRN